MYEDAVDYLKMCKDPQHYMNEPLKLVSTMYNSDTKKYFPVMACGDIKLYFNHSDSAESAMDCWERRKKRINWDNLFVMMYTEDYKEAMEFTKLPYEKKVCFVPFASEDKSLIHIEFRERMADIPFWEIINKMARGVLPYYDVLDLIEKAEFTKVVDIL